MIVSHNHRKHTSSLLELAYSSRILVTTPSKLEDEQYESDGGFSVLIQATILL